MAEFIIDMPRKRKGYKKMMWTVFLHFTLVLLIALPLLIALLVLKFYFNKNSHPDRSTPIP